MSLKKNGFKLKKNLVSFAIPTLLALSSVSAVNAKEFISIGGGGAGGTFNTMASGVGSLVSKSIPDAKFTVEGSAGSVENLRRIGGGDLQMGVAFSGDSYLAYNGLEAFESTGKVDNIRVIGFLYSAISQVVTADDSGIKSIYDLEGKKMSVGSAGSGTQKTMMRLLDHLGLTEKMDLINMGGSGSSDQLKNGQIDAYHGMWGAPAGAIVDSTSSMNATLIDLWKDVDASGFFDKYPFYSEATIKAGTYANIDHDVHTFRDTAILVASADLSDDIVYEIAKKLYSEEGLAYMLQVSNATREMSLENGLAGMSIPLHKGAERFWKEAGIEIPNQ
ncbi:TAXI family TRAP transporter solute-binding subunit [Vibrio sp. MA40-2]|uniref:TAXI family TRAP transporter solute-binding subunit n=1 Tax=Vibrio sp. MA40-2 TaxID=3391828 RepID=UPI0039A52382